MNRFSKEAWTNYKGPNSLICYNQNNDLFPYKLDTCLENPDIFDEACQIVRLMSSLGRRWEDIKKHLIGQFEPYHHAHPDLEIIQTTMGMQRGKELR